MKKKMISKHEPKEFKFNENNEFQFTIKSHASRPVIWCGSTVGSQPIQYGFKIFKPQNMRKLADYLNKYADWVDKEGLRVIERK